VSIKKQVILIIKIESLKKAVTPEPSFQMIKKYKLRCHVTTLFQKKLKFHRGADHAFSFVARHAGC